MSVEDKTTRTIVQGNIEMPSATDLQAVGIGGLEVIQRQSEAARIHIAKVSYDDSGGLVTLRVGSGNQMNRHGIATEINGDITPEAAGNLLEALLIWKYRGSK